MIIMYGKELSDMILERLKEKIKQMKRTITLSIILCGNRKDSITYTNLKKKKGEAIGMKVNIWHFSETTSTQSIINNIENINMISDGVIVQLPLPSHLDTKKIIETIDENKDVDGLTEKSLGKLLKGDESFSPATPKGVIRLLEHYNINVKGKNICIVNYSNIIGKPLSIMLANRGGTVTVCHKETKNLSEHTRKADILISGTGTPHLIKENMVANGAVVVDVGFSHCNGRITGDVDFENVKNKCSHISPVPNGAGAMTVTMLLEKVCEVAGI